MSLLHDVVIKKRDSCVLGRLYKAFFDEPQREPFVSKKMIAKGVCNHFTVVGGQRCNGKLKEKTR